MQVAHGGEAGQDHVSGHALLAHVPAAALQLLIKIPACMRQGRLSHALLEDCLDACMRTNPAFRSQGSSAACLQRLWISSVQGTSRNEGMPCSVRTAGILERQVDMLAVLERAVQLDDVFVLQLSMDSDLAPHLCRARSVLWKHLCMCCEPCPAACTVILHADARVVRSCVHNPHALLHELLGPQVAQRHAAAAWHTWNQLSADRRPLRYSLSATGSPDRRQVAR